jgi:O-antigen/teichoic acid export membrane protein
MTMRHADATPKQSPPVSRSPQPVTTLIAHNVSASYLVIATEIALGIFMLPFNVSHLGKSAYGLWMLVASVTVYFSVLDMGYGWAQVRFAAKYRAQNDAAALNELASTMFGVFSGIGLLTLTGAAVIAWNLDRFFPLAGDELTTGRIVLLVLSGYVALSFPMSVFGGIVNGFQRQYLNGVASFASTIFVALANVLVLRAGHGLVALVTVTTAVRVLAFGAYAANAYRAFPALRIRPSLFKPQRLREVTGFSVFVLLLDIANKLNYSTDAIVVGAFLGTSAVAVWAVAQRLIEIVQRVTDQLNGALFPVVVDSSTVDRVDRLQRILIQGTRLSLAMVLPLATLLALVARPLVFAWVGPTFGESVHIIWILSAAVALRVGSSTSSVILKGGDHHKFVAGANLSMAVANLALSVLLVRAFGLVGVAVGTLVPIAATAVFVVFPRACRRVGLPPATVVRASVWPALWPTIVVAGVVGLTSPWMRGSVWLIAAQSLGAAALYLLLFFRVAIDRLERGWYLGRAREVFRRHGSAKAASLSPS